MHIEVRSRCGHFESLNALAEQLRKTVSRNGFADADLRLRLCTDHADGEMRAPPRLSTPQRLQSAAGDRLRSILQQVLAQAVFIAMCVSSKSLSYFSFS